MSIGHRVGSQDMPFILYVSPFSFLLIVLLGIFSNSINKAMVIEHRNQERLTTFTTIKNAEN